MHDIKEIRSNPQEFARKIQRRGETVDVNAIVGLDEQKRLLTAELDALRAKKNAVSKQIGELRKKKMSTAQLEQEMRNVGDDLKSQEQRERELEEQIRTALLNIPNLPDDTTPDGKNAADNVLHSAWGQVQEFDFEVKDHLEIAENLNILDFRRGGKVTGTGFPVWSGDGARLERALINFMLDTHTAYGYREMITPFLANRDSMLGSGQIPRLEDDMYFCDKDDLFIIPTSEVTLINLHRDDIIPEAALPIKYAAYSPCFRREAGTYGKDTRGFQRVHQFNKVEMVRFEKPEDSDTAWLEILNSAESILQALEIPYRVIRLCAGDMGFNAAACFDIEVWAPAFGGRWLEASSVSNCRDFQARRANIRYRQAGDNKTRFVHILNGSGLATSRLMVALLENNQTAEGSVIIPPVIRKYLNNQTCITA